MDSAEDNGVLGDLFFLVMHVAEVDLCLGLLLELLSDNVAVSVIL